MHCEENFNKIDDLKFSEIIDDINKSIITDQCISAIIE